MPCYNCSKRAIAFVQPEGSERILLCLDCYERFMRLQQQQLENNERMINFALDQMHAILPIGNPGPRLPPRPAPIVRGAVLNHINVSNSVVGTINTGTIASIDQTISAIQDAGGQQIANALAALSQAIIETGDLSQGQKQEALDAIEVIGQQAAVAEGKRKKGVARAMLDALRGTISTAADVIAIFDRVAPVLRDLFA